jgi:cell division protein ZapE
MTTPSERYQELLMDPRFKVNPLQKKVVEQFDILYNELCPRTFFKTPRWLHGILSFWPYRSKKPIKGLYLYGGVGIGKTWLLDIFFSCLPEHYQLRMHFHQFMQHIHQELKYFQGLKNPLKKIAKDFAKKTRVLCFDEFFVLDIGDAMILYGVLKALSDEGVTLVTTSNVAPQDLYRHGVSRENFIPAIELIKRFTRVFHLESEEDYRKRTLEQKGVYYFPLGAEAEQKMSDQFTELAGLAFQKQQPIRINGRLIPTRRSGNQVIWFNFNDLCNIPRSQLDYLEIVRTFHTILLSHVPQIPAKDRSLIYCLINLVDIAYDANVRLIISAASSIDTLYTDGIMKFEFERTKSRLKEMQSMAYWQRPHCVR